jgi:hypothetical protein
MFNTFLGLNNPNLLALDMLSWWAVTDADAAWGGGGGHPSIVDGAARDVPPRRGGNLTYVHVHKCVGMSIQSAMYAHACAICVNAPGAAPLRRAGVRTFKHSFRGSTRKRREFRDRECSDHIQWIANAQSLQLSPSSSHPIFTVLRNPIKRFLLAICTTTSGCAPGASLRTINGRRRGRMSRDHKEKFRPISHSCSRTI